MDTYGTDALRFTIVYIAPLGQDVLFGEEKCEFGRNFATKIWNAARLVFMQREKVFGSIDEFNTAYPRFTPGTESLSDAQNWILGRYHEMLASYHKAFSQFRMNDITRIVYDFFRGDYCDWYLETLKIELAEEEDELKRRHAVFLAVYLLEGVLKVLHPVMPFITEEIWHHILQRKSSESIARSAMPDAEIHLISEKQTGFAAVQKVISEARSLRAVFGVPHDMTAGLVLNVPDERARKIFTANAHIIIQMTGCSIDISGGNLQRPPHSASSVVDGSELFMPLEGLISFEKEIARLEKELGSVSSYVKRMQKKLANKGFVDNAPADVIEDERRKLSEAKNNLEKLQANLEVLGD
ncbi:MAG: class I tRNA ligase family protein, partial [Chlorobiales bacterium]|nr:class I tRNA ligase family protein [Chlorobiales bacterium]